MKMTRRDALGALTAGAAAALLPARADAATQLEGYTVEPTATVAGSKLQLNGAGVRRRAYFKAEMGALYLASHQISFEGVFKAPGPKRIHLVILRDFSPNMAAKMFLSDFKASASDEEYSALLEEVRLMGEAYSRMARISRGDVVDCDWIPGTGFVPQVNGQMLLKAPIASERFFRVVLQNYVGTGAPADYRNALLGLGGAAETPAAG
ncbi:MAG: hypothetical protein EPO01_15315 [Aquabacterium sp.]|nr:MAG: hypothetical protein EPO01_15315 [Aquabacterium sp.]